MPKAGIWASRRNTSVVFFGFFLVELLACILGPVLSRHENGCPWAFWGDWFAWFSCGKGEFVQYVSDVPHIPALLFVETETIPSYRSYRSLFQLR